MDFFKINSPDFGGGLFGVFDAAFVIVRTSVTRFGREGVIELDRFVVGVWSITIVSIAGDLVRGCSAGANVVDARANIVIVWERP